MGVAASTHSVNKQAVQASVHSKQGRDIDDAVLAATN